MPDSASWQRQLAENAQRYLDLQELVARLSISETSRDGMVRSDNGKQNAERLSTSYGGVAAAAETYAND